MINIEPYIIRDYSLPIENNDPYAFAHGLEIPPITAKLYDDLAYWPAAKATHFPSADGNMYFLNQLSVPLYLEMKHWIVPSVNSVSAIHTLTVHQVKLDFDRTPINDFLLSVLNYRHQGVYVLTDETLQFIKLFSQHRFEHNVMIRGTHQLPATALHHPFSDDITPYSVWSKSRSELCGRYCYEALRFQAVSNPTLMTDIQRYVVREFYRLRLAKLLFSKISITGSTIDVFEAHNMIDFAGSLNFSVIKSDDFKELFWHFNNAGVVCSQLHEILTVEATVTHPSVSASASADANIQGRLNCVLLYLCEFVDDTSMAHIDAMLNHRAYYQALQYIQKFFNYNSTNVLEPSHE